MSGKPTVAVLGAGGTMGRPMARNLARAGFGVRAWNRSREKAEPLTDDGVDVLDSPREAADSADIVLTILSDSDAVLSSMEEVEPRERTVWIQSSTIGERGTERCLKLARSRRLDFIDAPVLGTKQPAEDAELVILASGPSELRERVQPLFDAVGQRTMWVGDIGCGTRLKVAVNNWILSVVEGTAETFALAEGLGLDPQLVLEAVGGGSLDLPYLQMKGKAIIERDFEPSFRLALAAKDAALIDESASLHGLDLPLARTVSERLAAGAEKHPDQDMIATYLTSSPS